MMKGFGILALLLSPFLFWTSDASEDQRAEEILRGARAAIGGEDILRQVQGMAIRGKYRRMLGERQMAGDREISIGLPDKFLVEDAFSPGGLSTAVINTRGLNGERAWTTSGGGGGGMVFRMAGPGGSEMSPEQMEAILRQQYTNELTRYLVAILATPLLSSTPELKYVGESDVDDLPVDVVEVTGPGRLVLRVFFDRKTHLPLLLSYRGNRPRVITMNRPGGGARTDEDIRKAREEAERSAVTPAAPEQVDFFVRIESHKKVGDLVLPHKLTFLVDTEVSEEFEVSKYQLNPQFKADKFQRQ